MSDDDAATVIRMLRTIADEQVRTNYILERIAATAESKAAKRKPRQASMVAPLTAEEKVQRFELDGDLVAWGRVKCPSVPLGLELEAWKDRMAANGYKVGRVSVQDARRAFQTACRNAEQWGTYRKAGKASDGNGRAFTPAERKDV